jgi:hypothetical protein
VVRVCHGVVSLYKGMVMLSMPGKGIHHDIHSTKPPQCNVFSFCNWMGCPRTGEGSRAGLLQDQEGRY